jgi:hypothetical protein
VLHKLVWLLLTALLALAVYGISANGLLLQPIWSDAGLRRLLWFSAVYWILALAARRRFPTFLIASAILYSIWTLGLLAVGGLALLLAGAWGIGLRLLPNGGILSGALGLAAYALITGALAHLPINTPALYLILAAAGIATGARRLASALRELPRIHASPWLALPLYPACIHLLAALFPEASSDGLAMHLTVPAWVAAHRQWSFDPEQFSWALMPMSGDWAHTAAYLLGGEPVARLLNFAMLAMLASLVYSLARRAAARETSLIVTALFLSTPVAYLVTGSLFIENFWTLMACGALAAILHFRETGERRYLPAAGLFAGAAVSAKLLAIPVVGMAALVGLVAVAKRKPPAWRHAAVAAALALAIGAPPYLEAFLKTGNPVFPMYNTVFRSPLFATDIVMADPRYPPAPLPRFLWDATFHSTKYLDGHNGSLGFHYWLLLPLTLLCLRRKTPYLVPICLSISLVWILLVTGTYSYLRYLYPSLALLSVAFVLPLETMTHRKVIHALSVLVVLANTYFLSAGTWYTRDLTLPPWKPQREQYLDEAAPLRALVDYFNRTAYGEPVAFLDEDQVAGLAGPAYSASWHTWLFRHALDAARTPGEVMQALRTRGIRQIAAPSSKAWFAPPHPAAWGLLSVCGEPTAENGKFAAYLIRPECGKLSAGELDRRYLEEAPFAPPGEHQDISTYVRYRGHWLHDRQFVRASGHTLTYTRTQGDSVQFRFQGKRVRVTYTAAANRGTAQVILDGKPAGTLRQTAAETRWQSEAFFDAEAGGPHTLELRHAGDGLFIDVDRFLVE